VESVEPLLVLDVILLFPDDNCIRLPLSRIITEHAPTLQLREVEQHIER
jgi:hypothetical protein